MFTQTHYFNKICLQSHGKILLTADEMHTHYTAHACKEGNEATRILMLQRVYKTVQCKAYNTLYFYTNASCAELHNSTH